jgi:hypothetical protein
MLRRSYRFLLTNLLSSLLLSLLVSASVVSLYKGSNQDTSLTVGYVSLQKELDQCLSGTRLSQTRFQ